jgi:hypothetical protein
VPRTLQGDKKRQDSQRFTPLVELTNRISSFSSGDRAQNDSLLDSVAPSILPPVLAAIGPGAIDDLVLVVDRILSLVLPPRAPNRAYPNGGGGATSNARSVPGDSSASLADAADHHGLWLKGVETHFEGQADGSIECRIDSRRWTQPPRALTAETAELAEGRIKRRAREARRANN